MQVQAASSFVLAPIASGQTQAAVGNIACLEFINPETVRGGCGYFDSSFELSHGLQVTEELNPILLQLWARLFGEALSAPALH